MFKVIADRMEQWYLMVNAKNTNFTLMFISSNHDERIVLSNLLQLE